jgi:hypothetical protein
MWHRRIDMRTVIAACLVAVLVAACGGDTGVDTGAATTVSGSSIHGRVTQGPTCPVQRVPAAGCEDKPVKGATIVLRDADGTVVANATTGFDGTYELPATPGQRYTVEAQRVAGLLTTPEPQHVTVPADAGRTGPEVDFTYDTGIRN